jgi:hypothetical protein
MNFIEEIFEIARFDDEQKQKAIADLDTLVKARVVDELISSLPESQVREIESMPGSDSAGGQAQISAILKAHCSPASIAIETEKVSEQVIIAYLDFMFDEASQEDKDKVADLLRKYNMPTTA